MTPSMMDPPPQVEPPPQIDLPPQVDPPPVAKNEVKIDMEPPALEEKLSISEDLKKKEQWLDQHLEEYEEKEQPPEYFITRIFYQQEHKMDKDIIWSDVPQKETLAQNFWDLFPFIEAPSDGTILPNGNDHIYFLVRDLKDVVVCLSVTGIYN